MIPADFASDPRAAYVARQAGHPLVTVIGVYAAMCAHGATTGGTLAGWDKGVTANLLGMQVPHLEAITSAMEGYLLREGALVDWPRFSKRHDPTGAARVARHRERKRGGEPDPDFEEFWDAYPRKVGKDAARLAYAKARIRASAGNIIAGLARARWPRDPQYIPHPSTWLNQGRWQDGPDPAADHQPAPVFGSGFAGEVYSERGGHEPEGMVEPAGRLLRFPRHA